MGRDAAEADKEAGGADKGLERGGLVTEGDAVLVVLGKDVGLDVVFMARGFTRFGDKGLAVTLMDLALMAEGLTAAGLAVADLTVAVLTGRDLTAGVLGARRAGGLTRVEEAREGGLGATDLAMGTTQSPEG